MEQETRHEKEMRRRDLILQVKSALTSLEQEELINNKHLVKIWEELGECMREMYETKIEGGKN